MRITKSILAFTLLGTVTMVMTMQLSYAASPLPDNGIAAKKGKALPRNSVGPAQLRNNAVTTRKIRNNAVTTNKIRNSAVTGAKIAAGAVGSAAIANGAVMGANIAVGAVGTTAIANGAVTGAKIAAGSVGSAAIANGAVTGAKIAAGSVGSAAIANGAVTGAKVAPGSVGSAAIINGSVGAGDLASGAKPTGGRQMHNATGYVIPNGGVITMQVGTTITVNAPAAGGQLLVNWSATLYSFHNVATDLDTIACLPLVDSAGNPPASVVRDANRFGYVAAGRSQGPIGGAMFIPISSTALFSLIGTGTAHTVKLFCVKNATSTSLQQVSNPTINAIWMPAQY